MLFKKRENRRSYDTQSMDKLRQLTEQMVSNGGPNGLAHYGEDKTGLNLLNIAEIAIVKAYMPKGTKFELHTHISHEYVIVYKGRCVSNTESETKNLIPGGFVHFKPGEKHTLEALEDSEMIGITIPAAEGYPK